MKKEKLIQELKRKAKKQMQFAKENEGYLRGFHEGMNNAYTVVIKMINEKP
jgi:hypothetical protein